jgi:D-cysteine desulfhydrase
MEVRVTDARPPRLSLARLPTPLERSRRIGPALGVNLYWKRDDLTGIELSGNKIRKLEFLLADAEAQGADTVITCGGEQSNHCRATALAAAQRGLGCVLLLRVPDPSAPPAPAANSLLDRVAGAQIRYVSFAEYRRRDEIFAVVEEDLRRAGRRPYRIPEGGSNALGAWGYIAALEELREQIAALGATNAPPPITIAYAAGSGGTGAGLELGLRLTGWTDARALGFAVCDDRAYFQQRIAEIAGDASRRWNLGVTLVPDDVAIDDRFIGPGYARSTPELLAVIPEVARADGPVLDPVYTGKAFFGLRASIERSELARNGTIVFLHTGGIFGLFPFASELLPVLG